MLAISEFIYEEICKPCGCEILYWSEHNYSLHIYEYDLSIVKNMKIAGRNPMLSLIQVGYNNISSDNVFEF